MGREIRRVPPNYQHPKDKLRRGEYDYRPMYDQTFAAAVKEWKEGYAKFEAGERPSYHNDGDEYWECEGPPPEREMYPEWDEAEATWYCLYETVSEGTPVSPPFATLDELSDYLARNGDFWDQARGKGGWGVAAAERFVKVGYAPSLLIANGAMYEPRDGM